VIRVQDLDVVFAGRRRAADRVHAVREVSFQVDEGESYGLVGESGSGKSTVLRAIAGLIGDWGGSIEVAGQVQGRKRRPRWKATRSPCSTTC
jgi:peptide/nickel transport system ATP-binding protein